MTYIFRNTEGTFPHARVQDNNVLKMVDEYCFIYFKKIDREKVTTNRSVWGSVRLAIARQEWYLTVTNNTTTALRILKAG